MKKILLTTVFAFSLFALNSCDRNFEEINTDTSRIKEPSAGSFLMPIQYEMGTYGYNRANDFTFDIMQVALSFPNEGNTISRYYLTESTGNGFWNTSYKWLKQVKELKDAAVKEQNNNYIAISKVLNAWIYANLTDAFGDVPFSEALRTEENILRPKYDSQKDIYVALLEDLKVANSMFDTTKTLPEGDLFYHAETNADGILKWKKFCNSLSLRLLTRILKRNGEVNVHQRINEIINDPVKYPIFQNNAEGATLDISGVAPLLPPIARPQDFTAYRASGEFFTQTLVDNNDPRLSKFFTQAKSIPANANIGYKGAPSGYALGTTFDYVPSNMNQNLAKAPLKILILPYTEVQFILAELANKGIIAGSAQAYYENGVKAAIEQWGSTMPANYFANANVAYNGTLERIMLQKYVALFFVDHQQWYEQRRTGLPVLPNNGGLLNNGQMPQRMPYPTTTKIQNYDNYQAAAQAMGGDNINVKMWWNK
ncbi:SusD/RagB family nutrient-binding outer membrane lipoprotein [Chryseobacterium daecheongense]|uniref:SusD/RagB family nutrient-binding outer membrane lipoprotein n=1 Tax=Chryseobacterium daecheongense TaxID=192389 RepID=UPI001FD68EB0|nr:SusD/RagB family nutrient-binding outer membrane lipoprotein [Chryseobacterium daecheongense]UOU98448.1 SusD/RagB family nutrient-binding outer membrane lipoprotein [Chryseobacterium daecheongense]